MPRGGKRTGTPGKPYPNRTDLAAQPVSAPPARVYGDRQRQEQAQQAIPLPAQQAPQLTPIGAPSGRPNEPITAGLPMGAGPGADALAGLSAGQTPVLDGLRNVYQQYPTEGLRRLIERAESAVLR